MGGYAYCCLPTLLREGRGGLLRTPLRPGARPGGGPCSRERLPLSVRLPMSTRLPPFAAAAGHSFFGACRGQPDEVRAAAEPQRSGAPEAAGTWQRGGSSGGGWEGAPAAPAAVVARQGG